MEAKENQEDHNGHRGRRCWVPMFDLLLKAAYEEEQVQRFAKLKYFKIYHHTSVLTAVIHLKHISNASSIGTFQTAWLVGCKKNISRSLHENQLPHLLNDWQYPIAWWICILVPRSCRILVSNPESRKSYIKQAESLCTVLHFKHLKCEPWNPHFRSKNNTFTLSSIRLSSPFSPLSLAIAASGVVDFLFSVAFKKDLKHPLFQGWRPKSSNLMAILPSRKSKEPPPELLFCESNHTLRCACNAESSPASFIWRERAAKCNRRLRKGCNMQEKMKTLLLRDFLRASS